MSLYYLQKILFDIGRHPESFTRFNAHFDDFTRAYQLDDIETGALRDRDIGLLYVLGVNCQLLMYFAATLGVPWTDYLQLMRDGVRDHGPVRAGVYAMTTQHHEKVAGL